MEKLWDLSLGGFTEKAKALGGSLKALVKKGASSYHPDILESLTEFIIENSNPTSAAGTAPSIPKLDAVVLTGDLATTGRKTDIDEVKRFFTANPNPRLPYKSKDSTLVKYVRASMNELSFERARPHFYPVQQSFIK